MKLDVDVDYEQDSFSEEEEEEEQDAADSDDFLAIRRYVITEVEEFLAQAAGDELGNNRRKRTSAGGARPPYERRSFDNQGAYQCQRPPWSGVHCALWKGLPAGLLLDVKAPCRKHHSGNRELWSPLL